MPCKLTTKTLWLVLIVVLSFSLQPAIASSQEHIQEKVFEDDFKSRYSGRKFNYEGKDVVNSSKTNTEGQYSDYKKDNDPKIKENNNSDVVFFNSGLSWIFIIILIIAVVYLAVSLLSDGSTGWFSTRQNSSLSDYQNFNVETATSGDFMSLITKAENENDYRLAIRYYFLYVLKSMSLKNIIKIEEDKTNAEYLREINNEALVSKFSSILYLYNYTWYGEFSVSDMQYKTAKNNFNTFLNQLKK